MGVDDFEFFLTCGYLYFLHVIGCMIFLLHEILYISRIAIKYCLINKRVSGHGGSDGLHAYVHSLDDAVEDTVCTLSSL